LTLESADFANSFFRSEPKPYGLITLSSFVFFWGWVFLITTTIVLIFKKEVDYSQKPTAAEENELEFGIVGTYKILLKILQLKPVLMMTVVLLTGKIAFAATDGITSLKLIEMGVPKDKLAGMAIFLTPLQVLLPWMIGKYTAGPRPLNIFLWAYPYRIFMSGVFAALVWWTPSFKESNGAYPALLYAIWIVGYCFHQIASYCMFVSMMAFNAQISDPKIGGTYMTLLNTLNNLGGNWPVTLVLSLTDRLTWKNCVEKDTHRVLSACHSKVLAEACQAQGNVCEMHVDGYYLSVGVCSIIGVIWLKLLYNRIKQFQKIPRREWSVVGAPSSSSK